MFFVAYDRNFYSVSLTKLTIHRQQSYKKIKAIDIEYIDVKYKNYFGRELIFMLIWFMSNQHHVEN